MVYQYHLEAQIVGRCRTLRLTAILPQSSSTTSACFSVDEARQGEESIYTSFTREPDSESDDEIYPEESQATAMDYQVQDKVAKIQVADQFVIYLWLYSIEHLRLYAIEMYLRLYAMKFSQGHFGTPCLTGIAVLTFLTGASGRNRP